MRGLKVYKLEKNKKKSNLIIGELKKNFNFECNRFFSLLVKRMKSEVITLIKTSTVYDLYKWFLQIRF